MHREKRGNLKREGGGGRSRRRGRRLFLEKLRERKGKKYLPRILTRGEEYVQEEE